MGNSKRILIICLIFAVLGGVVDYFVDFNVSGHFEGFYLTKLTSAKGYEFSDHLIVGKEKKLVFAWTLNNSQYRMAKRLFPKLGNKSSHLYTEWNPWDGSGLVSSSFPDGTGIVTYLGRYLDDEKAVHGLFVGGGVPETIDNSSNYNMNNSGITYFDGKRWFHVWCSVNEGISSEVSQKSFTPSQWEFIGSGVESRNSQSVVIASSHKIVMDEIPVRIDRKMHFTAGEDYFNLEIKITNLGVKSLHYSYAYGDEPWVGYYGTSLGDVGWVKDRIINYEEMINTSEYSYIGMADIGNKVIGEKPVYTNMANFLEWFGPEQPMFAYFTNNLNHYATAGSKVPLESNERFLGLRWERWLKPSESSIMRLAIGMAGVNPKTGMPEKPPTRWK